MVGIYMSYHSTMSAAPQDLFWPVTVSQIIHLYSLSFICLLRKCIFKFVSSAITRIYQLPLSMQTLLNSH